MSFALSRWPAQLRPNDTSKYPPGLPENSQRQAFTRKRVFPKMVPISLRSLITISPCHRCRVVHYSNNYPAFCRKTCMKICHGGDIARLLTAYLTPLQE